MKNKFIILLTIITMLLLFVAVSANAEKYGDYLSYTVNSNNTAITITGCDSSATEIEIPSEINGIPVTSIDDSAFSGCSGLTSITIPDSVTGIGRDAFNGCSGITSVYVSDLAAYLNIDFNSWNSNPMYNASELYVNNKFVAGDVVIPHMVTKIPNHAFHGCDGITSITIPDSVTNIDYRAFSGCSGLTSITIPDSVTSIGVYAFSQCSDLMSITIGNSVTSIGERAFYNTDYYNNTSNWESGVLYIDNCLIEAKATLEGDYAIKNNTRLIGDYAFSRCSGLTSITIPDSTTNIGDNAFSFCNNLTSITIPDSVTSIDEYAFSGCSGLTNVTIPDSVTSIDYKTFSGCRGLTSITIPASVTSIDSYAFYGCSGLTSVTIPDSVTSIDSYAFSSCDNLKSVYFSGTEAQWGNINIKSGNDSLTNANIIFNSSGSTPKPSPIPITTINVTKSLENNTWKFEVEVGQRYSESAVYAVIYDNDGNITGINRVPLETDKNTTVTAPKTSADKSAKIFVWTDNMQPITAAENITL